MDDTPAAQSQIDRLKARETMLATLSHEIRTPLNGVLGMAGLLADTRLDATQQAYLKTLRECGEHLLGLVNDALDYAKLESGRIELEPTPTDVEALLQGVCELLSPRAHAAGVEIAWATVGPVPPILADDGRLRQILFNLAGNAVKLTKAGGVTLTALRPCAPSPGAVRLRFVVADTGPGLGEADQARIFEEFVQTAEGERAGGAGLGLAIVRRLADAFKGDVGVIQPAGRGRRLPFRSRLQTAGLSEDGRSARRRRWPAPSSPSSPASAIVRDAAILQVRSIGRRARSAAPSYDQGPAERGGHAGRRRDVRPTARGSETAEGRNRPSSSSPRRSAAASPPPAPPGSRAI